MKLQTEKLTNDIRFYANACQKLKEQNENTQRAVPAVPPLIAAAIVDTRRPDNKLQLARLEIPKFLGKMHEYPSFCDDWRAIIEPDINEAGQLHTIRLKVPQRNQKDVASCAMMADVWALLDAEYGKTDEIAAKRI